MNGVLNFDKPVGWTSFQAVRRCRAIYGVKKAGHAGTLDPLASGVLPILIGNATGAAEYLLAEEKAYDATFRVGRSTDTEDCTGTLICESEVRPSLSEFQKAAQSFLGETEQIPPMYSALKKDGVPLYKLARRGETLERAPRKIRIFSFTVAPTGEADVFALSVRCSKGTYIRTLITDLAARCGAKAVMESLTRVSHGDFTKENCVSFEALSAAAGEKAALAAFLTPVDALFPMLPRLKLPAFYERLARSGAEIYPARAKLGEEIALGERALFYGEDGTFFALAEKRSFEAGEALKPIKLFL